MNRRKAVAEDLRKVGTGLILAGVVGIAFKPDIPAITILYAVVAGLIVVLAGVAFTPEEKS